MSASMIVSAGLGNSSLKDLVESNACLHEDVVRDKLTGIDEFCYTILPSFGIISLGYCDRLSSPTYMEIFDMLGFQIQPGVLEDGFPTQNRRSGMRKANYF
jgi:hypothetical protein